MIPSPGEFCTLRNNSGLTQEELAKKTGLSQSLIARIENGTIDTRLSTAAKILSVLRKTPKKEKPRALTGVMNSPVVYCNSNDTIRKAIGLMQENAISQLPVMQSGSCIGSLNETHLVKLLAKHGNALASKKVGTFILKPLPTLDFSSPPEKAVALLAKNPAVLVERAGNIAGIITKADILRLLV